MRWLSLPFLLSAAAAFVHADAKDDAVAQEIKKLEGTWVLMSGEKEGQPLPPEVVKKSKLVRKGKEVAVDTPHQSKDTIKSTHEIDPTKNPKEMTFLRVIGPDAGKKMLAIYEWIDPDQYRVVFAPAGKDRPKEFATKPGTGQIMHVWKRVKD
ncbi:hypothetical protein AYO44_18495 [Planctomycetaceae bacterium SCGC AG-212-F19]|nr:hypothetical protein AYO44_18495 [Planctomycetaceae bacterium SCGC AG-212-F19]